MNDLLQDLAEKLRWEVQSWKTVELTVTGTMTAATRADGKSTSSTSSTRYVELATGERWKDHRVDRSGGRVERTVDFFDGQRGGFLRFDPQNPEHQLRATLTEGFGSELANAFPEIPLTLRCRYLVKKPLHLALPSGRLEGRSEVDGRECATVFFEKGFAPQPNSKLDLRYQIDVQTGVPLQLEMLSNGKVISLLKASSLDGFDGRHFAKSCHLTLMKEDGSVVLRRQETISAVQFNADYPKSMFSPKLEESIPIQDEVQRVMIPPKQAVPPSDGVATTEATPPSTWDSWTAPALVGSGLLCLVLAGVFVFRKSFKGG